MYVHTAGYQLRHELYRWPGLNGDGFTFFHARPFRECIRIASATMSLSSGDLLSSEHVAIVPKFLAAIEDDPRFGRVRNRDGFCRFSDGNFSEGTSFFAFRRRYEMFRARRCNCFFVNKSITVSFARKKNQRKCN